ncbi:hypothetical protein [Streptomyces sp. NPDC002851]
MIAKWSDIINALTALYTAVNLAFGLGKAAIDSNLNAVNSFPKPGGAYDHQAV